MKVEIITPENTVYQGEMKQLKLTALLAVFVLTASFGFAQKAADSITIPAKTIVKSAVSDPTIYISDIITGGQQNKEALLKNPFLSAKGGEVEWSIVSYKVTFVRMKGNSNEGVEDPPITVKGAKFTDEIISKIKSAPARTVIEISDIRIQSSAGTRMIPNVLMVRIK